MIKYSKTNSNLKPYNNTVKKTKIYQNNFIKPNKRIYNYTLTQFNLKKINKMNKTCEEY